ncbi:MAG: hypothetical protein RLZZ387_4401 [Chloroflexota bacterium]
MGSWAELDATYPPDSLTPAAGFVAALGRLAGAKSVYRAEPGGGLAEFLPRHGIDYDMDLLTRAERSLRDAPDDTLLAELAGLLNQGQKLCLALTLVGRAACGEHAAHPAFAEMAVAALGLSAQELDAARRTPGLASDLSVFPQ